MENMTEDASAFVDADTRPPNERRCSEKQPNYVIEVAGVEERARAAIVSAAPLQSAGDRGEGGSRVENKSSEDMGIPPELVKFEKQRQLQVPEADHESAGVTVVFGENDESNRINDDMYSTTTLVPHEACEIMPARETSPADETRSTRSEDGSRGGSAGFGSEPAALTKVFGDVQPSGGGTSPHAGPIPPRHKELDAQVPKTAVAHSHMSPVNISASNLNPSRASWSPASTATTLSESSPTGMGAGSPTLTAAQHCAVGDERVAEPAELKPTEKFYRYHVSFGEVDRTSLNNYTVMQSASEEETAVATAAPTAVEHTDWVAPYGTPLDANQKYPKPSSELRATAADRPELLIDNSIDNDFTVGEKPPTLERKAEAQQRAVTPEKEARHVTTHLAVDTAYSPPGWRRPAVEYNGVDSGDSSVEGGFDTAGYSMPMDGTERPFHEQHRPRRHNVIGSPSSLHYCHQPHSTPIWGDPPAGLRPQHHTQYHGVPEGRGVYHPSLGHVPPGMVILPATPPGLSGYNWPASGQAVVRMPPYVVPGAGAGFDFAMQHDRNRYGYFPGNRSHADFQHHVGSIGVAVGFRPGFAEHHQLAGNAAHGERLGSSSTGIVVENSTDSFPHMLRTVSAPNASHGERRGGSSTGIMVENSTNSFPHMQRTVSSPTPPNIARAVGAGDFVGRASRSAFANETLSTLPTARRCADSTVLSPETQPSASTPITTALPSAHALTNPTRTSTRSMATLGGHAATASTADRDKGQTGGDLHTSAGLGLSSEVARAASSSEVALGSGASGVDGDSSRRDSAYNDIGLVVTRTKELEKILKDLFGATGSGLNEQLSSLREGGNRIDRRTQSRIRSIAAMRNKLVHSVDANNLTISNTFGDSARRAFKIMVDDLEVRLRESALEQPDESSFEEPARPPDAYTLGNHPAFWGMGGGMTGMAGEGIGGRDGEAVAAAARKREEEAVVVKDTARFPHNIITACRPAPRDPAFLQPAPDVTDEVAFPAIAFASSAAAPKRREHGGNSTVQASATTGGSGGALAGMPSGRASVRGGWGVGGEVEAVSKRWDGQGRIEETQIISGRTLGQGEVGYVATTHTMSGVYRKWDYQARNPAGAWKNIATTEKLAQLENTSRVVPGATSPAKGQVAFEGRGFDSKKPAKQQKQRMQEGVRASDSMGISTSTGLAQGQYQYQSGSGGRDDGEGNWEEAVSARHRRFALREDRAPHHYVVQRPAAQPFWLLHGAQFGKSNCRGWFPTRQDWCARGIPECVYVPLEPSTEDRVAAMQFGHEPLRGLTLEEDEERLMRIAIRESAAESKRAYEKKYGTQAEREARRKAHALGRIKAMAERESLERDEQEQLTEVIKASLADALGPGEKDDRNVIAAIEASKLEDISVTLPQAEDPAILVAIEESRRQHQAKQEMLQRQFGSSPQDSPPPSSVYGSNPNATTWNNRADPARAAQDQVPATSTWGPPPPAIPRAAESTPVHNAARGVPTPPSPPLPRFPLSYNTAPASSLSAEISVPPLSVQGNTGQERFPQPGISRAGSRARIGDDNPALTDWSPTPALMGPEGEGNGNEIAVTAPVADEHVGYWHSPRASATTAVPLLRVGGVPAALSRHTLQRPAMLGRSTSLYQHTTESLTRRPVLQQRAVSFEVGGTAASDASRYSCLQSVPWEARSQVNVQDQGQGHGNVSHRQDPTVLRSGSGMGWARNNTTAPCLQAPFPTAVRDAQQTQDYPEAMGVANAVGVAGAMNAGQVPGVAGQHGHAGYCAGALTSQQQPYLGSVHSKAQQIPRQQFLGDEGEIRSPGPRLAGWATGRIGRSIGVSEKGVDGADEKSRAAEVAQAPSAMPSDVMPHAWEAEPSPDEKELMQAMELSRLEELARQKNLSLVTDDDQELLRAMEESRAADLAREQEETDAKAAMDMALKLSVDDIGGTRISSPLAQALADSPQSPVSPRTSGALDSQLSPHTAASPPTDDTVMSAEVPVPGAVAGADNTAINTATGACLANQVARNVGHDERLGGMDGSADAWVRQQHGLAAVTPQAPMPSSTNAASLDRQGREEQRTSRRKGDAVQQQLRRGMGEEKSYDELPSPGAVAGDRTNYALASTSASQDTSTGQHTWGACSSRLRGPMDDTTSTSGTVGGGDGGEAGANAVDEELARVLEQSRLEVEQQQAARAAALRANGGMESEEEIMARVVAESLQEMEGREIEQLAFQRAMEASLM